MKKFLVLLLTVALVACVGMTSFADEMPTVKISNMYFSKNDIPAYGTAPETDHQFDYSTLAQCDTSHGDSISDENGVVTYVGGTAWFGFVTVNGKIDGETGNWHEGDNAIEDYKYMAYKIENASSKAIESAVIMQILCSDGVHGSEVIVNNVRLYNTDGTEATDVTYGLQDKFGNGEIRGYLNIPAGKTVWVVIPMTATNIPLFVNDANGALSLPEANAPSWTDITAGNMYFYAYQTTLNWAPVIENEDPSNEADISVIAYAAAAIAGLGALAIAKKR